ncbi:MAG: ABC transporter substrate-binding protein [Bacteroidota bacterium]
MEVVVHSGATTKREMVVMNGPRRQLVFWGSIILSMSALMFLVSLPCSAKVQVRFWHILGGEIERQALETAVAAFNRSQDTIEVVSTYVADGLTDNTKLLSAIVAGVGPDIYLIDRFTVPQRAHAELLLPVDAYIDRAGLRGQYLAFTLTESTYEGKTYAFPLDTDSRGLYYRTDLFDEAGIDKPPTTIADLDVVAAKLTKLDGMGNIRVAGFIPWAAEGSLYTWGWVFGVQFYDEVRKRLLLDQRPLVDSLEWIRSYAVKYGYDQLMDILLLKQVPFASGDLAMEVNHDLRIRYLNQLGVPYRVAPIPKYRNNQYVTWSGGFALVIPKGSKHPDEAAKLAVFLTGPEGNELYTRLGGRLPVVKSLLGKQYLVADANRAQMVQLLAVSRARPSLPIGALLWDRMWQTEYQVIRGEAAPFGALTELNRVMQAELDKVLTGK